MINHYCLNHNTHRFITDSVSLSTVDHLFELTCNKTDPISNGSDCTAVINPNIVGSNQSKLAVGTVGFNPVIGYVTAITDTPIDVELLKKFLNGKDNWISKNAAWTKGFGGKLESHPVFNVACESDKCEVTLTDSLRLDLNKRGATL